MSLFGRLFGPPHCRTCGDELVKVYYSDGFRRDGTPVTRSWRRCPRNEDRRPMFDGQTDCHPPAPWACANQRRAYAEHKPHRTGCHHKSVSERGDRCWDADGRLITGDEAVSREAMTKLERVVG